MGGGGAELLGMTPLVRLLGAALLLGTALHGAGAAVHPMLVGDAPAHLGIIAATARWRELHLTMLAGSALIVAGIWVRLFVGETPAVPSPVERVAPRSAVLAALAVISIGITVNALNVAYMAGAGWHMAALFQSGDRGMAAIYDVTHPIGLMAARFGNLLVALGALTLGWAEWRDAATPRWLALLAWAAAAGGLVGALFFDESSRVALAAVALLSGWQVATGARAMGMLGGRSVAGGAR